MTKDALKNSSDEELIRISRSGDDEDAELAEEVLMRRYKGAVAAAARGRYLNGGEGADLIQEGMIGLFEAFRKFSPDKGASFRTFALACIENHLRSALSEDNSGNQRLISFAQPMDAGWREDRNSSENPLLEIGSYDYQPEEQALGNENARLLDEQFLQILSEKEREVYRLLTGGHTYQEIARKLHISPKSADNAVQRVRGKIRRFLQNEGE